jgi:hypothetical protein
VKFFPANVAVITVVILFVFVLTESFVGSSSLTKDEAIKISRSSPLVQKSFENADRYTLEVHYQNASSPKSHGVWDITWYIHVKGDPSGVAIGVSQSIDEENGQILSEGSLILR